MRYFCFLLLFVFSFPTDSTAQEKTYAHFDVNNGLAGSTVYCMLQDKDGFIWFGTETGLSRFDGTHFRNFGVADGLPDNEILEMFEDSKGRIWMAPFKKAVCYYYKGKFYNKDNDSTLRLIKPKAHVENITEDSEGNILIQEYDQLHLISSDKHVQLINTIDKKPLNICIAIAPYWKGGFLVVVGSDVFQFQHGEFHFLFKCWNELVNPRYVRANRYYLIAGNPDSSYGLMNLKTGALEVMPYSTVNHYIEFFGDSIYVDNKQTGCDFYFIKQHFRKVEFMKDKSVSRALIDNEGNYWFTTLGEGVYRLTSQDMGSVKLFNKSGRKLGAYNIKLIEGKWFVAADFQNIIVVKHDSSGIKESALWDEFGTERPARATAIESLGPNRYLFGSDMLLQEIPRGRDSNRPTDSLKLLFAVKAIYRKPGNEYFVATNRGVLRIGGARLHIIDTVWNERATTVYYQDDTIYVGTLDGLFLVAKDGSKQFAGYTEPLLRNRVQGIIGLPDGTIWIATDGVGLVAYLRGRIVKQIGITEGLSSNNCRCIWGDADEIWVGTDKGLNRINLRDNGSHILKLTTGDGLSSNQINAVTKDRKIVIVATPEGLNYFEPTSLNFESRCNLVMDNIKVSDRDLESSSRSFSLPHRDNNIHFQFAGISFRSGGQITYQYRLVGLDTSWKTTQENFLDYPTLPSGDYRLELTAMNKFGVKSNLISIPFTVEKLLAERTWFRLLALVACLALLILFVYALLQRVRKRELEKSEIQRKIGELEQAALKSQMNPHFIFNCLNSIQQFVLEKDIAGSNRFITGFSRLIRQTLDVSTKKEISLAEEILYLSTYLELEKTRFEGKFVFELNVDEGLNVNEYFVPPMMLQPFVENSIRHGIRYRKDGKGKIVINFRKGIDQLVCFVEDNGIGRKEAMRLKSNNPIEYQSKGMSLIASRIEYLNRDSSQPITLTVEDLVDRDRNAQGTRVMMKFPLNNTH